MKQAYPAWSFRDQLDFSPTNPPMQKKRGISATIEPENLHLKKNVIEVPLHKRNADMGLCSFPVCIETQSTTNRMHLRTVHPPSSSQRKSAILTGTGRWDVSSLADRALLSRKDGNCLDRCTTVSDCDICTVGKKSQEEARPRKITHNTEGVMELFTTELAVPLECFEQSQLES